jgi:hypothetical protein
MCDAALWRDSAHHMPNSAILARGIHALENEKDSAIGSRIEQFLKLTNLRAVFLEEFVTLCF